MRVDLSNPLKDRRVRQAIALSLDRPAIVKTLFDKFADVGNDSNFAPIYPSTSKPIPQRHKDLKSAKQLMAKAGHPRGFKITLRMRSVITESAKRFSRKRAMTSSVNFARAAAWCGGPGLGGHG